MAKDRNSKLGKWNKTEHEKFMKALQKYGKNWSLIQKAVSTRTLAQVRSHAQKLFLSMTKKELQSFQDQLFHRFNNFCKNQKIQMDQFQVKTKKKTNLKQNDSLQDHFQVIQIQKNKVSEQKMKIQEKQQKQLIESGLNIIESQKTQAQNSLGNSDSQKYASLQLKHLNIIEMAACQNYLSMSLIQSPQVGFYIIPSPNYLWMSY